MIDKIIVYPHPTLRHRSKQIKRVDNELRAAVAQMFDLMYEARGVGLAANQVDLPLRVFVINTAGERGEGEELVFINPVIQRASGSEEQEEGCLSLPGLYAPVRRSETIRAQAYNLAGQQMTIDASGLLARAIQHELDHLDGILFIDRLSETSKLAVRPKLDEFEEDVIAQRRLGTWAADDEIQRRLRDLEARYCA